MDFNQTDGFEITYWTNPETNLIQIKDFEKAKEEVKKFVELYDKSQVVIDSEETYKVVYKARTEINNKEKALATVRKGIRKAVIGNVESQYSELEKICQEVSNAMSVNLGAWKANQEAQEEETKSTKVYEITISSLKKKDIDSIKKYVKENYQGVSIK